MSKEDKGPLQETFFRLSKTGQSPWEIHRPQPMITHLVNQNIFHGNILDLGCGIGDNAVHIAKSSTNIRLTAIDFVPKTLSIAREKAKDENVQIDFQLVNILEDLSGSNLPQSSFDILLDSALFHCFDNEDRQRFIHNLCYLIKPGGLYIQFVFSEKHIPMNPGPRLIKQSDLNELFSQENGWRIQSIEDTSYITQSEGTFDQENQAYLSFIRRNQFSFASS